MIDDTIITDLKQFIAATVKQETAELRAEMQSLDEKFSGKFDDLTHSIADAMEANNEATDSQLQDHQQRITRLEHRAA